MGLQKQTVTITIKNVNEAPMITGGFTRISQAEYDDGTEAGDVDDAVAAAKMVDTYMATDPEITDWPCSPVSWPVAHGR